MTTQAQVLSVAWDHSLDAGAFSLEFRQALANALASLKIAGPWRTYTDGARGVTVWQRLDYAGTSKNAEHALWLYILPNGEAWPSVLGVSQPTLVEGAVEDWKAQLDTELLALGWVLCPQPKEGA